MERTLGFLVFYCDIAIDSGLDGKIQIVRAVLYQNAALKGRVRVGALHRNSRELVALPLQFHTLGADSGNRFPLDARARLLHNRTFRRG